MRFSSALLLLLAATLGGCKAVVLAPAGDVALQQRDLLVISTGLMLIIIIPVLVLIGLFAWRYRQGNTEAAYEPEWDHSTMLELLIWSAPLLIVICLGALTWMGTHLLDPYRPLDRLSAGQSFAKGVKPLDVQVVALDWKWLFFYPEYGIASVNMLVAPTGRPLNFHITASSVMNSFYIPALAGQIYAMPAMETQLHAVMNQDGTYQGFSANYSGAGFSGMHFTFQSTTPQAFAAWVEKVKQGGDKLDRQRYLQLMQPSENEPIKVYASADADLYDAILNLCVLPNQMCMNSMMATDAMGGRGMQPAMLKPKAHAAKTHP